MPEWRFVFVGSAISAAEISKKPPQIDELTAETESRSESRSCQVRSMPHRVHARLDGVHEAVKVIAQGLQASRIQQEQALTRGIAAGARGAGLGEGDLLVLAQEDDLVAREAERGVRDGVGWAGHVGRDGCAPSGALIFKRRPTEVTRICARARKVRTSRQKAQKGVWGLGGHVDLGGGEGEGQQPWTEGDTRRVDLRAFCRQKTRLAPFTVTAVVVVSSPKDGTVSRIRPSGARGIRATILRYY